MPSWSPKDGEASDGDVLDPKERRRLIQQVLLPLTVAEEEGLCVGSLQRSSRLSKQQDITLEDILGCEGGEPREVIVAGA